MSCLVYVICLSGWTSGLIYLFCCSLFLLPGCFGLTLFCFVNKIYTFVSPLNLSLWFSFSRLELFLFVTSPHLLVTMISLLILNKHVHSAAGEDQVKKNWEMCKNSVKLQQLSVNNQQSKYLPLKTHFQRNALNTFQTPVSGKWIWDDLMMIPDNDISRERTVSGQQWNGFGDLI